jgi:hypothetical protein
MPVKKKASKASTVKTGRTKKAVAYQVFISHSSADAWIARQMAKEIGALKIRTWLDEKDLAGGDNLNETILAGIRACQETVVLVSPASIESQWVSYEIGATDVLAKRITPILHYVAPSSLKVAAALKMVELNEFEQFLVQLQQRANA